MVFGAQTIGSRRFIRQAAGYSALFVVAVVGINLAVDLYGLFRPLNDRLIPVYNNERVSKYLLSYRYIPGRFNTVLFGTSLSANLDVSPYTDSTAFKIYNASVMGINLTEMKPIVQNTVQGGVKNVIMSISPYMLETSGSKVVDLNRKIYYGAFGSIDLYQTYFVGIIRQLNLLPNKFPKGQINGYGVNDYRALIRQRDVAEQIDDQIEIHKNDELKIDPVAVRELKEILEILEKNDVKYIIYYHPVPARMYESRAVNESKFRDVIKEIVPDTSRIVDFNTAEQLPFTTDLSNYLDHGHLSGKGQQTVTYWLYVKMKEMF
jgi:hypothetical protein